MPFDVDTLDSPTGARLALRTAPARGPARGIVQVHHGMSEHSGRYAEFAAVLAERGFHVGAHDHRGHGHTQADDASPGVFAHSDGWTKVVDDARAVEEALRARFPDLPLIVFGHSMGGVTAMGHAMARKGVVAGLAVWNANLALGARAGLIRTVLLLENLFKKKTAPSTWMDALTFRAWGRAIKGRRTDYDWLSRLPEEVDAYVADPLSGRAASISLWRDYVDGSEQGEDETRLRAMRRDLPIHLAGGGADPATDKGKALKVLAARLYNARFTDVTMRTDPKGRHETHHDEGKAQAMADFADWAERVCALYG